MSNVEAVMPMAVIVGPTASGKSPLAMHLAELFGGEVLACDSTQLYRHFNIGTAKATETERRHIPHHLIDLYDPDEISTAGEYRRHAIAVLEDLRSRERLPILAAGTGLYLRALLEGLADAPLRSEELRARLEAKSAQKSQIYLHRVLTRMDREAAARIAPNDRQKLIRAIEVCVLTGRRISEVHRAGRMPLRGFRAIKIGLMPNRAELKTRISNRIGSMLERGWLDEVRQLVALQLPQNCKPFDFIGYRELRAHLEGVISLDEAVIRIDQSTRHYAKRQLTWFRKDPAVRWFEGFGDNLEVQTAVREYLKTALANPATRTTVVNDV